MGHVGIDREALDRFLTRVQARFPLKTAIVFGSRARGDELAHSDYDLVLVSDAFGRLSWTERMAEVSRLWDMDVGFEALCYTPEEFARKAREIGTVGEAVREGRDLVDRHYGRRLRPCRCRKGAGAPVSTRPAVDAEGGRFPGVWNTGVWRSFEQRKEVQ